MAPPFRRRSAAGDADASGHGKGLRKNKNPIFGSIRLDTVFKRGTRRQAQAVMRLPPPLPEPSPQDVLLAQSGDRVARHRVYVQRWRIRKRERERERILAEQQDGAQGGDDGVAGAEQSDALDGAAALLDAGAQGGDALCDDAGAGGAGDAGFEDDGGFDDGGFDDDDDDAVLEQVGTVVCVWCATAFA